MSARIPCRWTGEAFEPLPRFRKACDAEFVIGLVYDIETVEERSGASHRYYFARINEVWQSLPEDLGDRYPTPEHLRKKLLVEAGYRDETSVVCSSAAEARRLATFVRAADDYAVVVVRGPVIIRATAKSQSLKAMGKEAFEASKTAVLDLAEAMIGVQREAAE